MLQVRLLAGVTVERDGEQVPLPPPAGRLLAFLAVNPGRHERESLAGRFWPDSPVPAARANLRTAVWAVRKCLGEELLLSSRETLGLRDDVVQVDVVDALRRVGTGDLAAAEALSRDELLPTFGDDWADAARRRHRATLLAAFAEQADRADRQGDAATAARWSRLRCELEPLDEPAHAALVRNLAASGDRAGALLAGRDVVARLREELGVSPGPLLRTALAEARGRQAAAPAVPAAASPLYGRDAELRALTSAWTTTRAGHGRVVVVTGEAGIGKTRLVAELATRADNAGARVAVGAGVDVGGQAPLAVWQELVPALARGLPAPPDTVDWPAELSRLVPGIAARLGCARPPPPVAAPELERLRLFDAVLRLVEWAAGGRPVLLVAEDVHRADSLSMQLAAHLGRRIATLPVLLVLTRRDRPERAAVDELVADLTGRNVDVAQVDLGPIAAADLAAISRSVAPLTDDEVEQVVLAADGNPLLAVETARAVASGVAAPPSGLRALVRAATGSLPPSARTLVELLATAGRALTAPELAALPLPDLDDAQRAALDTGLVRRAGGGLRFGHALVAETVRADLGEENWHHEQLAHAIETSASTPDAVAAEVAEHLHRAGPDDLAAPRWARAARYARSLGALDDAARFWTEAVRCTPGDVGSRLELVEVLGWLGQEDAFEREWRAALDYAAEDDRADVWSRRGKVLRTVVCHPSASLAAYRQAAELLPAAAPTRLRVEILFGIAWGESSAGDPARAEDVLDEIAALVPEPDDTTRAELANVRVMTLIRLGRFAECAAVAEEGGRAAARAARPDLAYPIWVHTACALSCAGNLAGALRVTEQAVAATRGTPALELPCLAAHAFVLSRLDRHDDAIALADEQLALAGRIDSPALAALARHDAGLIASAAGRYAEAVELLGAGLDAGAAVSRPAARLVRAEALARLGRVEEAAAEVRAAALEPVRAGDLPWALVPQLARVQGVVAQARGDRAEARRRLEEALGGWRRHVGHDAAAEFLRNFLDLGRPPIVGLVEPARELRRVEAELAALDQLTEVS